MTFSRLRQADIGDISDRELRRIENGEVFPHAGTLEKLASAHGMSVDAYMNELANRSGRTRRGH